MEIGCGSGREARFLSSLGCPVTATDASAVLLEQAQVGTGDDKRIRYLHKAFPLAGDDPFLRDRYDLILAIAVLMHIADEEFLDFCRQIRQLTRENGHFICSFCTDHGQSAAEDNRLYVKRGADEVRVLFERVGFRLLEAEDFSDGLARDSTHWITMVFQCDESV